MHVNAYVRFRAELKEDLTAKYKLKKEFGHSRALVKKWSKKLPEDWVNKKAIKQSAAKVDYYYRLCSEYGVPYIPVTKETLQKFNEIVFEVKGKASPPFKGITEPCSPVPKKIKKAIRAKPEIERQIAAAYSGAYIKAKNAFILVAQSFDRVGVIFNEKKYPHTYAIMRKVTGVSVRSSKRKINSAAKYLEFCYNRALSVLPGVPEKDAAYNELVVFVREESPTSIIFGPLGSSPLPLSYIQP